MEYNIYVNVIYGCLIKTPLLYTITVLDKVKENKSVSATE
jgi:hypothetical protein